MNGGDALARGAHSRGEIEKWLKIVRKSSAIVATKSSRLLLCSDRQT